MEDFQELSNRHNAQSAGSIEANIFSTKNNEIILEMGLQSVQLINIEKELFSRDSRITIYLQDEAIEIGNSAISLTSATITKIIRLSMDRFHLHALTDKPLGGLDMISGRVFIDRLQDS